MKLFDLHCDTAIRLLQHNQSLCDNTFHISLKKAEYLESYAQVMAVYSQKHLSDAQAYERFFEVAKKSAGRRYRGRDYTTDFAASVPCRAR